LGNIKLAGALAAGNHASMSVGEPKKNRPGTRTVPDRRVVYYAFLL